MRNVQVQPYEFAYTVDILIHGQQHLDAHENQDDTKAVFQILEVFGHGCQGKVQGSEPKDGKDVGCEHNERVAADAEHRGNTIDGKGDIGGLDDQQGHEQGCGHTSSVLCDEEAVAMYTIGHWIELAKPSHNDVLRRIRLLVVVVGKHLAARIEQEESEESQHPLEALHHGSTGEDEDAVPKKENSMRNTNRLSIDSDFSIRYPAKNSIAFSWESPG